MQALGFPLALFFFYNKAVEKLNVDFLNKVDWSEAPVTEINILVYQSL
jgi:hypothetical protein